MVASVPPPARPVAAPMVGEEEIVPHLGVNTEAYISRIPVNVDFHKMDPRTNDFNLQGNLKIFTENPLHFGAVNLIILP